MTETTTAQKTEIEIPATPAPSLPAVRQERRPRNPSPSAARPPHFPSKIAKAIISIMQQIGAIQKEGQNEFQKYRYVRWEDINEKLSPLLAQHGLIIVQSEQSRSLLEENDKGSVLAIVYHFTIINDDGEQWPPVEWTSIARLRDQKGVTDDKAAAKCHTQAEKQFCIKQFKIRSDDGYDDDDHHQSLPKKNVRDIYEKLQAEIDSCTGLVELGTWGKDNAERIRVLPKDWQSILQERFAEKRADLENQIRNNPEYVDEETGEISAPPVAETAAPVTSAPQPPTGAATPPVLELLAKAREAARRGEKVFQAFYKRCNGAQKGTINQIGDELRGLMDDFNDPGDEAAK